MEKHNIHQINISAPNLIVICIDKADTEEIEGRFYHCYGNEPVSFVSIVEFLTKAEKFFDLISFPQASTRTRNFDSKIRNDKTILTSEELQYCENDGLVVYYYIIKQNSMINISKGNCRDKNIV